VVRLEVIGSTAIGLVPHSRGDLDGDLARHCAATGENSLCISAVRIRCAIDHGGSVGEKAVAWFMRRGSRTQCQCTSIAWSMCGMVSGCTSRVVPGRWRGGMSSARTEQRGGGATRRR
jgi:hypothetical protein